MRVKPVMFFVIAAAFVCVLSVFSLATIQCIFYSGATCPAGNVKFLGVENDTNGFSNAHVQNRTVGTYAYSFCCNETTAGVNLSTGCDGATFLKLSSEDNAHVQGGNNTDYNIRACMNSTYQNISCNYPSGSCGSGDCLLSIASSEGVNYTNAHVGNCSDYSTKVCCGSSNSPPSAPQLVFPANSNNSVSDRYLNFSWNASTDLEGNPITYTLNASCGSSCRCSSFSIGGISATNLSYGSELCIDVQYNWTVTACDIYSACNTSARWNFTIPSVVDFVLIVNTSAFGGMGLGESKQTNASLGALVGRNNGNVRINATINSSALFSSVAFPSSNYLYKAADNESGSIVAGCSQTSLSQISTAQGLLFCNLSWVNTSDEVKIDINVTVPLLEAAGLKESLIEVVYASAEI